MVTWDTLQGCPPSHPCGKWGIGSFCPDYWIKLRQHVPPLQLWLLPEGNEHSPHSGTTALLLSSLSFSDSSLPALEKFHWFFLPARWGTAHESWSIVFPTRWLLFIKPKLWSSSLVQTLEPSPLWIQNKTISQSKAWLIQIQNAVISDSVARYEFKNLLSISIKLFELFLCRHQSLPSSNSEWHYQLVENFRMILGNKRVQGENVQILSQYIWETCQDIAILWNDCWLYSFVLTLSVSSRILPSH